MRKEIFLRIERTFYMKTPSFLSPYVDGISPARLIQGFVVGVAATLIVGFSWAGWQLGSTADERVDDAASVATVSALAPICAEKFRQAATTDNDLVVKLAAIDSWRRDQHLMDAGWVTFPSEETPNNAVAVACAKMLSASFEMK